MTQHSAPVTQHTSHAAHKSQVTQVTSHRTHTMKFTATTIVVQFALLWIRPCRAFLSPSPLRTAAAAATHDGQRDIVVVGTTAGIRTTPTNSTSTLKASKLPDMSGMSDDERAERMQAIVAEETMNPVSMAEQAERMKDMKPEDMDSIIQEMDSMDPVQAAQLKAMGMDPDLMKKSLLMMKENPNMMATAQKMMENMSPQQLAEQSRMAQEQMSQMTPEQVEVAAKAMNSLSPDEVKAAAEMIKSAASTEEQVVDVEIEPIETTTATTTTANTNEGTLEGSAQDPNVIDAMFRTAEFMSEPPTGGVTFKAFATLPPMTVLSGTNEEEDLSPKELKECWADGSLGSTRVDRAGFERVWNEVREFFEDDILESARKTILKRSSPTPSAAATAAPAASVFPTRGTSNVDNPVAVGANLTPEQLEFTNNQVKNMSEDDFGAMLDQMKDMSPEQEARMKAMGVNTEMMAQATKMMGNNPMMRKAAQSMMKNMSPDQMLKASQQAQQQMKNMSPEDYQTALDEMKKKEEENE